VGQGSRLEVSWCDGAYPAVVAGEAMMCPARGIIKGNMRCECDTMLCDATAAVRSEREVKGGYCSVRARRRGTREVGAANCSEEMLPC
jgi:hypothetical protein